MSHAAIRKEGQKSITGTGKSCLKDRDGKEAGVGGTLSRKESIGEVREVRGRKVV